MKSRLTLPTLQEMTPSQAAVHASILRTRPSIDGPFLAWMHSPELASRAEQLGAFCRFGTGLSLKESELLILCVAGHMASTAEQQIHEPIALNAGLSDDHIAALRSQSMPTGLEAREQLLCELAFSLLQTNRIPDGLYQQAQKNFGAKLLVEVVGIIGYYAMVAHTLNAFEMSQ